jgi:CBS domain-containing protein
MRSDHFQERYLLRALTQLARQHGDWSREALRRIQSVGREFVAFMRAHVEFENREVFGPALKALPEAARLTLARELERFDAERRASTDEEAVGARFEALAARYGIAHGGATKKRVLTDIMSKPVVAVAPGSRVDEVLEISRQKGFHHFPVLDGDSLRGLVCTCDLRDQSPSTLVGDLLRRAPVTVPGAAAPIDAARSMAESSVGSALVLDGGAVVGIVTREDLAAAAPELASMLEHGHCAACGTAKHLRPRPGGAYLCADCSDRARRDDWYETGGGD